MIKPRLHRHRRPPVVALLVSTALLASLWWVLSGPEGSLSGQPCYRSWLRIVAARSDQDEALGWTLLRHAMLAVGGPQESRVYVRPEPDTTTNSVRDVTLLAFRVWAPGRDAASVQRSLAQDGSAPMTVEPLCGPLGATELAVPGIVVLTLAALLIAAWGAWWYRFRSGAS